MPVVIVSYSFWKRHGADAAILGHTLRLNGRLFTVVGITPEGFTGTTTLVSAEIYVPLGVYEAMVNDFDNHGRSLASRDNHALIAVGRLRSGVTLAAADAQLAGVAAAMQKAWPVENKDQTLLVRPLARLNVSTEPSSDDELAVPAILLLCMAAVVLLIASLNVANMMLARGAARRKEIAIRLALGGGRRYRPTAAGRESDARADGRSGRFVHRVVEHGRAGKFDGAAGSDRSGVQRDPGPASAGSHLRLLPA
jgi:ABC-type antimicrobial peptide transport system permease subunit